MQRRIWFERTPAPEIRRLAGAADLAWRGPADEGMESLLRSMAGAHAAIASAYVHYDAQLFARLPTLRVVSRTGIGVDNIDLAAATAHGVAICNAPDAPSIATAEFAVSLMLFALKRLGRCSQLLARPERPDFFSAHDAGELAGRQLGLVGLGRIGGRVARIALAFGMNVAVYDPFISPQRPAELGVQRADSLEALLAAADIVSLHLPATPQTRQLIDARALAQMKPGALLVNTARGALVDEDALLAALQHGHLAGAALDVFASEPPPPDHPLLQRPDVVATPHVAGVTLESKSRLWAAAIEQALQVLRGQRPPNLVNADVWPRRRGQENCRETPP